MTEAIDLYRRSGFVEVAAFNDEPYGDYWFEKRLVGGHVWPSAAGQGEYAAAPHERRAIEREGPLESLQAPGEPGAHDLLWIPTVTGCVPD